MTLACHVVGCTQGVSFHRKEVKDVTNDHHQDCRSENVGDLLVEHPHSCMFDRRNPRRKLFMQVRIGAAMLCGDVLVYLMFVCQHIRK